MVLNSPITVKKEVIVPHYIYAFEELIQSHLRYYKQVTSFSTPENEIIEIMMEDGVLESELSAQFVLESVKSNDSPIEVNDWFVNFDHFTDEWLFQRILNYTELKVQEKRNEMCLKRELANRVKELSPREFEELLYEIFSRIDDYDHANIQPQSHDGGYEMFVRSTDEITGHHDWILIQAKHQKKSVSISQVRELIGTLDVENYKFPERQIRGLMISIIPASEYAINAAKKSSFSITFMDLDMLVRLMISKGIGYHKKTIKHSEIDSTYWDNWG
jgi:restriction endonuclease Mrr